jgi:acyl carrier protein
MTTAEILNVFTRILGDLLLDDSIVLTMDTRREEIRSWDSFNYLNFIVAVEVEFGVKFKIADIESFVNVGAIVAELMRLLYQKTEIEASATLPIHVARGES